MKSATVLIDIDLMGSRCSLHLQQGMLGMVMVLNNVVPTIAGTVGPCSI